jgi:hypothetical protein
MKDKRLRRNLGVEDGCSVVISRGNWYVPLTLSEIRDILVELRNEITLLHKYLDVEQVSTVPRLQKKGGEEEKNDI